MTVITDENHIVQSISLIRGLQEFPSNWHIYEDISLDLLRHVNIGEVYMPMEKSKRQIELEVLVSALSLILYLGEQGLDIKEQVEAMYNNAYSYLVDSQEEIRYSSFGERSIPFFMRAQ